MCNLLKYTASIFLGANGMPVILLIIILLMQHPQIQAQVFRDYYSDGILKYQLKKDKNKHIVRGYYQSGALEFVAYYKKGELDGVVREYYENGMLKAEIPYKDNRRHGLAKFYYENGMLMGKIEYKRGRETGEAKFYDENGILTGTTPRLKRRVRRANRYEARKKSAADSIDIDRMTDSTAVKKKP